MSRLGTLGARLYRGDVSYDFVGKQKRWYAISGVIVLVTLLGLILRPLQLGIEFRGGAEFRIDRSVTCTEAQARDVVGAITGTEVVAQKIGSGLRVQTEALKTVGGQDQRVQVQQALAKSCGVTANDVSSQSISGSWGRDITNKAIQGLVIFLVLVALYMAAAFREWKMSAAALIALAHDLVITAGVYAWVGFEVTPATVTGLLTILGYSLYDTVVVFDKVAENVRGLQGGSRMTYSDAANLALNQTLVRSINTSIIALMPVGALLFIGAGVLGAGTLKDLSLALFIGLAAGAYSSIFIATPLLCDLKEREPAMQALAKRVQQRRATGAREPVTAGVVPAAAAGAVGVVGDGALPPTRPERPHRRNAPARKPGRPSGKRRR
jgi:preprotein translocase subunit SecF